LRSTATPICRSASRRIAEADLPAAEVAAEAKLVLLGLAIRRLAHAGYGYIGMDHFALPDDERARAATGPTAAQCPGLFHPG
jgi:hypothetical protein